MEGYEVEADGKVNTIFSALNYCNQMINKGAIIKFIGKNKLEPEFVKFENSLHPDIPIRKYMITFLFLRNKKSIYFENNLY